MRRSVLQCVAVCCIVLQCVAVRCSLLQWKIKYMDVLICPCFLPPSAFFHPLSIPFRNLSSPPLSLPILLSSTLAVSKYLISFCRMLSPRLSLLFYLFVTHTTSSLLLPFSLSFVSSLNSNLDQNSHCNTLQHTATHCNTHAIATSIESRVTHQKRRRLRETH